MDIQDSSFSATNPPRTNSPCYPRSRRSRRSHRQHNWLIFRCTSPERATSDHVTRWRPLRTLRSLTSLTMLRLLQSAYAVDQCALAARQDVLLKTCAVSVSPHITGSLSRPRTNIILCANYNKHTFTSQYANQVQVNITKEEDGSQTVQEAEEREITVSSSKHEVRQYKNASSNVA